MDACYTEERCGGIAGLLAQATPRHKKARRFQMTNMTPIAQPWSPPTLPAQGPLPNLSAHPSRVALTGNSAANYILVFALFVVVSRLPELLGIVIGSSLKVALLALAFSAFVTMTSGRVGQVLSYGPMMAIVLFSGWFGMCIPFSRWAGGSFMIFKDIWSIGLVICFAAATVPANLTQLRQAIGALAWSSLLMLFMQWKYSVFAVNRTFLAVDSTLANPNILCMQLLIVAPCLLYWVRERGFFSWRGMLGTGALVWMGVVIVLQSGSRSGLLGLIVVTAGTLFFLSMRARILLLVCAILGSVLLIPAIPRSVWSRYSTIFGAEAGDISSAEASASATGRLQHLKESIEFTIRNPIFGVGPGQFMVASADQSKDENTRAAWRETHNTYTQVSSETGIMGLVFYLAMIISAFRMLRISRKKHAALRLPADTVFLMGLGLLVTSSFGSAAYMYYWPLFAGLSVAIYRVGIDMARYASPAGLYQHPATALPSTPAWTPAPQPAAPTLGSEQGPARVPTYLRRR
jgi:O-antigen ligase